MFYTACAAHTNRVYAKYLYVASASRLFRTRHDFSGAINPVRYASSVSLHAIFNTVHRYIRFPPRMETESTRFRSRSRRVSALATRSSCGRIARAFVPHTDRWIADCNNDVLRQRGKRRSCITMLQRKNIVQQATRASYFTKSRRGIICQCQNHACRSLYSSTNL